MFFCFSTRCRGIQAIIVCNWQRDWKREKEHNSHRKRDGTIWARDDTLFVYKKISTTEKKTIRFCKIGNILIEKIIRMFRYVEAPRDNLIRSFYSKDAFWSTVYTYPEISAEGLKYRQINCPRINKMSLSMKFQDQNAED